MLSIEYDYDERVLFTIDKNNEKKIVSDDFPSPPNTSPNKERIVYISPLEWECYGSVYLFDLTTGYNEVIIPPNGRDIPKDVIWVTDNYLAVIIGFGDGTISIGGNVFIYSTEDKKIQQITKHSGKVQFTRLSLDVSQLIAEGIIYTDDNFIEFDKYRETIEIAMYI